MKFTTRKNSCCFLSNRVEKLFSKEMGCSPSKTSKSQMESAASMKAAILIQRWHRRHLARLEMRRRCTWNIFQSLEYASEQDESQLYKFFNDLLLLYPEAGKGSPSASGQIVLSKTSNEIINSLPTFDAPDDSYRGPHLLFPLAKKDIDILIDLFRRNKGLLHRKYVIEILDEAASKLKELPNVNVASTTVSKQITIVGDLHGKLEDLLVIFHKNGLPSAENPYVFNGDFVDRGRKGLEVLLLVLSCFLAFPGSVFPNRGNHEDTVMNGRYGFTREMQIKYGEHAETMFKHIEEVYRWLPLGTIVNNRVLIVHGGISDTTNLDLLKRLNRSKYRSILRPPQDMATDSIDKAEWKQIFDLMWSDPMPDNGCKPNTTRGAGTFFGPDVTIKFLSRYRLVYLIRSHECKPDGYEFVHGERVVTIFSASNYYAAGSNRGAYMKLNPQLDPYFVQYIAAASRTAALSFEQKVGVVESSALRELGARLRAQANVLVTEFQKYDPNNTGQIPASKWCLAMETATNLDLPWHLLSSKLAPGESQNNYLNYKSTLELLETDTMIEAAENETSVTEALYKHKSSLEAIFHILDKDNSGHISLDEFSEACDLLERRLGGTTSKATLLEMCKLMDLNGDGYVDLNEFLETFRLCSLAKRRSEHQTTNIKRSSSVEALAQRIAANVIATPDPDPIDPTDYEIRSMKPQVERLINILRATRPSRN